MVDIHCHVLPQVDDGAKSWEVAAAMCRMAEADDITHIVATPHANEEYVYHREEHAARLLELQKAAGEWPVLSLGCDFHFSFDNVQDTLKTPECYLKHDTVHIIATDAHDTQHRPPVLSAGRDAVA
jgi:protein-tyrosine phosphatase